MNVLLVAEEAAGIQTLRTVAAGEANLVGVLTTEPTRGGGSTVAGVAERLGVDVHPSELVRERSTADWVREREVDLLLNVHSLFLIDAAVVGAPRIGSFNLHPGPLPQYAGLNAPSWAIYNGEPTHGVTVHWMEPGIDTGAIAYSASFELGDTDTGLSVSARCVREGIPLVERLLAAAVADPSSIPRIEQDLSQRRYYGRNEVPLGGRIAWPDPAERIEAFVRACDYFPFASPWGHPTTTVRETELAVLKAARTGEPTGEDPGTVGELDDDGAARVATGDEWLLVQRVQVDGPPGPAGDVLRPGERVS